MQVVTFKLPKIIISNKNEDQNKKKKEINRKNAEISLSYIQNLQKYW